MLLREWLYVDIADREGPIDFDRIQAGSPELRVNIPVRLEYIREARLQHVEGFGVRVRVQRAAVVEIQRTNIVNPVHMVRVGVGEKDCIDFPQIFTFLDTGNIDSDFQGPFSPQGVSILGPNVFPDKKNLDPRN